MWGFVAFLSQQPAPAQEREGLRLDPELLEGALFIGGTQLWAHPGSGPAAYTKEFSVPNGDRMSATNIITKNLSEPCYKK